MGQHNDASQTSPVETSQDIVEIRQEDAITIQDALLAASRIRFTIGKSTLQRWAKVWHAQGSASAVKCILVTTRTGSVYKLDRQDFEAWILEQKENDRSREIPQDLDGSSEVSPDITRSNQTPRDAARPRETSQDFQRSHQQGNTNGDETDVAPEF